MAFDQEFFFFSNQWTILSGISSSKYIFLFMFVPALIFKDDQKKCKS